MYLKGSREHVYCWSLLVLKHLLTSVYSRGISLHGTLVCMDHFTANLPHSLLYLYANSLEEEMRSARETAVWYQLLKLGVVNCVMFDVSQLNFIKCHKERSIGHTKKRGANSHLMNEVRLGCDNEIQVHYQQLVTNSTLGVWGSIHDGVGELRGDQPCSYYLT